MNFWTKNEDFKQCDFLTRTLSKARAFLLARFPTHTLLVGKLPRRTLPKRTLATRTLPYSHASLLARLILARFYSHAVLLGRFPTRTLPTCTLLTRTLLVGKLPTGTLPKRTPSTLKPFSQSPIISL